jgi:hypothetical protein
MTFRVGDSVTGKIKRYSGWNGIIQTVDMSGKRPLFTVKWMNGSTTAVPSNSLKKAGSVVASAKRCRVSTAVDDFSVDDTEDSGSNSESEDEFDEVEVTAERSSLG